MDSRSYTHTHTHTRTCAFSVSSFAAGGCAVSLWGLWEKMVIAVWQCVLSRSIGLSFFKCNIFPRTMSSTRGLSQQTLCLELIQHNVLDDDDDDDDGDDALLINWVIWGSQHKIRGE